MMLPKIRILDEKNKMLKMVSKEVTFPLSQKDKQLIKDALKYLEMSQIEEYAEKYHLRPGMGLAMIQLGVPKRIFVVVDEVEEGKFDYYTIIHPKAKIGKNVSIGKGSIIMDEAVINDNTKIGNYVIVNHGCIIDEEVIVEDYVNLLQSTALGKQVKVDSLTKIGRDVLVIAKISIGKKSIVKNGSSIVIEDVGDNCIMEGTPAKIIKKL